MSFIFYLYIFYTTKALLFNQWSIIVFNLLLWIVNKRTVVVLSINIYQILFTTHNYDICIKQIMSFLGLHAPLHRMYRLYGRSLACMHFQKLQMTMQIIVHGLFVCGFLSYGDITIADERLQILTYARHLEPLSSEGSIACNTYCDTGHPFIMIISEDP